MSPRPVVPSAAELGPLWGRAAHDWAELQEPTALPLWEAMLDAAAVGPGTRLLDAGCGAGGASVLASSRDARVNGIDAAEALLAIARARVPDGDFRHGDVDALPYADPLGALRELRRVCARQGRVVLALWGPPDACEQRAIVAAVRAAVPPLYAEPFALSAPGVVDALVAQAGITVLSSGMVACTLEYPDGELFRQAQASAGPLQAIMQVVGVQPLKAAVLRAAAPYQISTGGIRLQNHFRYVAAMPRAAGRPPR